nr:Hsp33 family molecular chaperone HslO [Desulfuromonadales bacterium]
IAEIEARIRTGPAFSSQLADGLSPTEIMQQVFTGYAISPPETTPLTFRCRCNRQQVANMLKTLDRPAAAELAQQGEEVEVTCEYCRQAYHFSPEELDEPGS